MTLSSDLEICQKVGRAIAEIYNVVESSIDSSPSESANPQGC
jgi:hypothetical protein